MSLTPDELIRNQERLCRIIKDQDLKKIMYGYIENLKKEKELMEKNELEM
jgi:hypothetical protein